MRFFNFKLLASRIFHLTYAVIRFFMFEKKPSGSSRISLKWKYLQMESNSGKLCLLILDYIDIFSLLITTVTNSSNLIGAFAASLFSNHSVQL